MPFNCIHLAKCSDVCAVVPKPKPFRSDASLRMLRWCHLPQRCAWQLACGQRMWTSKPSSWSDVVSHRQWLYGFFCIFYCCNCAIESSRQIIYADEASGVQQDSEHPANSTWKPWLMSHGPTCREVVENKIIHSRLLPWLEYPYIIIRKTHFWDLTNQAGSVRKAVQSQYSSFFDQTNTGPAVKTRYLHRM